MTNRVAQALTGGANPWLDWLPGFADERARLIRRRDEGLSRRDLGEGVFQLAQALGPGRPRPTLTLPARNAANTVAQAETVGGAAIRIELPNGNTEVFSGRTHMEAVERASRETGLSQDQIWRQMAARDQARPGHESDGFVTTNGRFVSREEAYGMARSELQPNARSHRTGSLASEDLSMQGGARPPPTPAPAPTPPPAPAPSPRFTATVDSVPTMLERNGFNITGGRTIGTGHRATTYFQFEDPLQPMLPLSRRAQPTVRVPANGHAGFYRSRADEGLLFDTATRVPNAGAGQGQRPTILADAQGRPYNDLSVLEQAILRRLRPQPEPPPAQPPAPEGADFVPGQGRLLSAVPPVGAAAAAALARPDPASAATNQGELDYAARIIAALQGQPPPSPIGTGAFASPQLGNAWLGADTAALADRTAAARRDIESALPSQGQQPPSQVVANSPVLQAIFRHLAQQGGQPVAPEPGRNANFWANRGHGED